MMRFFRDGLWTLRHKWTAVATGPCLLACLLMGMPARAQGIAVAVASAVTSMDPHFHNLSSNFNIALNIYDRLIDQDEHQQLRPGLATAWKAIDDTTWEFTLREGVTFHDGSPFGAQDVAATLRRVPWVPNSPNSYVVYTRAIVAVEIIDDHRIRFHTDGPAPLLPVDLSSVDIIQRGREHAPTADFNTGQAAVGTGPYSLVRYLPGDRVVLRRNENYWGDRPEWSEAVVRILPVSAARVAALLAGDVAAIDNVPPSDAARLRTEAALRVVSARSNSVLFLHMDSFREQTPFATDKSGAPLPRNPFRDVRIRRAISRAINRPALTDRLMEGAATPASQFLADGFFGVSPNLKPDAFDPAGARRLLAEAGYPDGFALTIQGPNDRYTNDAQVLQAIGPMLTRIGIETKVVTLPWSVFITQSSTPNYAYSMLLIGNTATTGENSFPLRVQVATVDGKTGMGASNRARYSNPQVDATLAEAMRTVDDAKRDLLLQKTAEIAMNDQAVVPLFYQNNVYATRKGYRYLPRADGYLAPFMIKPE